MISLGRSLIQNLNGADYSVERSGGGSYANGVWQESGTSVVSVFASVQPLSGSDLERIAQGDRLKEFLKLYSADEVFTLNEITGAKADAITIDGKVYLAYSVQKWPSYWKVLAVKQEDAWNAD